MSCAGGRECGKRAALIAWVKRRRVSIFATLPSQNLSEPRAAASSGSTQTFRARLAVRCVTCQHSECGRAREFFLEIPRQQMALSGRNLSVFTDATSKGQRCPFRLLGRLRSCGNERTSIILRRLRSSIGAALCPSITTRMLFSVNALRKASASV